MEAHEGLKLGGKHETTLYIGLGVGALVLLALLAKGHASSSQAQVIRADPNRIKAVDDMYQAATAAQASEFQSSSNIKIATINASTAAQKNYMDYNANLQQIHTQAVVQENATNAAFVLGVRQSDDAKTAAITSASLASNAQIQSAQAAANAQVASAGIAANAQMHDSDNQLTLGLAQNQTTYKLGNKQLDYSYKLGDKSLDNQLKLGTQQNNIIDAHLQRQDSNQLTLGTQQNNNAAQANQNQSTDNIWGTIIGGIVAIAGLFL